MFEIVQKCVEFQYNKYNIINIKLKLDSKEKLHLRTEIFYRP